MSRWFEDSGADDESFGPGTDLVLSVLAVLFVLIAVDRMAAQMILPPLTIVHPSATATARSPLATPTPVDSARQHLWDFCEESSEKPLFEQGTEVLTGAARALLQTQVEALKNHLRDGTANQLQLIGYASPETGMALDVTKKERLNLDLSVRRAMSVADFLYSRGVPYECISISAFGRSHSNVLRDWFEGHQGEGIAAWDEAGQAGVSASDTRLSRERRVEIWGIRHPLSQCTLSSD